MDSAIERMWYTMFRNSHFRQGHFKAWYFGGARDGEAVRVLLAGAMKRVAPVIRFARIKPVTGFTDEIKTS